ncbi:LVIVD repeat-containing protein [Granulicella arctica]|uniref:hypothetical protein n=1 Tax=Granulicella arctica TaxID=940613 RepID=UPI0021DFAAAA|nr:hypothetical protein [Granulicella arctica]
MHRLISSTLLLVAFALPRAHAAIVSHSKEIVVLQPQDLPEVAQIAGQSMRLRELGNGSSYLYIEQHQIGRLVILDVTDPGHIRSVGSVKLDTTAPFDFVRDLGSFAVLVCFRDNQGSAVVDFRKAKQPTVSKTSSLHQAANTQALGETGLLMVNEPRIKEETAIHDNQVVDTTYPLTPTVLTTVAQVQKSLTNAATGTTYLLGSTGLTVVRRPLLEEQERASQSGN